VEGYREDNNIATRTIFVQERPNKGILMGTVTNLSQQPLGNTLVIAIGKSLGLDMTDSNGRYIIPNLIPGKYLILAVKIGYTPQTKSLPIKSSPPPTILNFEMKKRKAEESLSFDEVYSLVLSSLEEEKTLAEEDQDPEILAFSAALLATNLQDELPFLETPGTATLSLENNGSSILLKSALSNISLAKIEVQNVKIEQGDLLTDRRIGNIFACSLPEGETSEGILAKINLQNLSEEPTKIDVHCTFVDCLGNTFSIAESILIEPEAPTVSELLQSYPNPADNGCYIPFKLSADSNQVSVEIYNILGQKVRTIEVGQRKAGCYTTKDRAIYWDMKNNSGQGVANGLYLYQLKAGEFVAVKSMVVNQ
jgi:hypothetical protein